MSKDNRRREYDSLVAAGRLNDISPALKAEFDSSSTIPKSKPPIDPVPAPKAQARVLNGKRGRK